MNVRKVDNARSLGMSSPRPDLNRDDRACKARWVTTFPYGGLYAEKGHRKYPEWPFSCSIVNQEKGVRLFSQRMYSITDRASIRSAGPPQFDGTAVDSQTVGFPQAARVFASFGPVGSN